MKKYILLLIIVILMSCNKTGTTKEEQLKVGEVWVNISKDPFAREPVTKYIVLDVRGGYVKYVWDRYKNAPEDYYWSSTIREFTSIRIKEK